MIHFGVVAPPFYSHFAALAALGQALREAGHKVTFINQIDAAALLRDSGLGFHAVGRHSHPQGCLGATMRRSAAATNPWRMRALIQDMARASDMLCGELPAVLEALHVDALICDQMEPAGGLVAQALGLPYVSVACALPVNREPGIPLPVMPFRAGTDQKALQVCAASERIHDAMMRPQREAVARHARRFGLPARGLPHEWLSPLAQVSQTLPGFDFPRAHLPRDFHAVGPLRPVAPGKLASVAADLPATTDRPLVFASLGTLQGHRLGLWLRIARACRDLGVQLWAAHCGGLDLAQQRRLREAGAAWVTAFADQQAAISRADAVITHAGLNTVMDAIAARKPMVALPIAFDQPGVAARIAHAGIGLRLSPRWASRREIAQALHRVLSEPAFGQALVPLGTELAQAGGARRASAIVLAACAPRTQPGTARAA